MNTVNPEFRKFPPGWLDCPKIGNIVNDRFVPFKTPIDITWVSNTKVEQRFSLETFLNSKKSRDVGLIIDLTRTDRYYDATKLVDIKCYSKIKCEGHEGPPTSLQVDSFIELANSFFELNEDAFVGVHCTHGFNRTGFMIVSYLCECCEMELDIAIHVFANARPPGIYKQAYLDELSSRYNFDGVLVAPVLPDWNIKPEPKNEHDNKKEIKNLNKTNENKKFEELKIPDKRIKLNSSEPKKVFKKVLSPFMEGVSGVSIVTDNNIVNDVMNKTNLLMRSKKSGFFGSQPVSMNHKNLQLISKHPYLVSWKADGTRYVMFISKRDMVYMIGRDGTVYKVDVINFPKNDKSHFFDTIIDGEMVIDIFKNDKIPRYLMYDIMSLNGEYVGNRPFHDRLELINGIYKTRLENISPQEKSLESFSVRTKTFWKIETTREIWEGSFRQMLTHEMDGLIFQPSGPRDYYFMGTCYNCLKWKPPELNSIDFLLKTELHTDQYSKPYYVGNLYTVSYEANMTALFGVVNNMTLEIKEKYDNSIVECVFDMNTKKWDIIRKRTDKTLPNFYRTAQAVFETIKHPVYIEDVYNEINALHKVA